jgi:hypothetical protein
MKNINHCFVVRATLLITLLAFSNKVCSQSFVHEYSQSIGSAGDYDWISDIAVDSEGNTVSVGYFSGQVDFDPSTGENLQQSNGLGDAFIAKYSAFGALIWVKTFGNSELELVTSIAFDSQNNILITGRITGSVDLDPGAGVSSASSNYPAYYSFVSKFNSGGDFLWFYSTPDYWGSQGIAIEVDPNDNAIIFREVFSNSGDLNVTKLSPTGEVLFNLGFGGPEYDYPSDMEVDLEGNIILSGHFSYVTSQFSDLDPGSGVYNVGGFGSFISKLDNNGNFIFANQYPTGKGNSVSALQTDSSQNIYCLGSSNGSADLDNSSEGVFLTPNGESSYFFKLDPSGNFVFGDLFDLGSSSGITWTNLEIDSSNNLYLSGEFYGSFDVDLSSSNQVTLVSSNPLNFDVVIVKFTSDGSLLASAVFGNNQYCDSRSSCVYNNGEFWVVGNFYSTFNFNQGVSAYNLISAGQRDAYTVKFSTCTPLVWYQDLDGDGYGSSITTESCSQPIGFTSVSGDFNDSSASLNPGALELCNSIDDNGNGIVDEGFDNDGDGYSICNGDTDDTNANVNPESIELCNGIDDNCNGQIDEGFDNDSDGYTNCEGDCNDSDQLVNPGQIEIAGNEIDENCDGVIEVSVFEIDQQVGIFPNPFMNSFCFKVPNNCLGETYKIYAADGRIIYSNLIIEPQTKIIMDEFSNGTYYIKVLGKSSKIIKL